MPCTKRIIIHSCISTIIKGTALVSLTARFITRWMDRSWDDDIPYDLTLLYDYGYQNTLPCWAWLTDSICIRVKNGLISWWGLVTLSLIMHYGSQAKIAHIERPGHVYCYKTNYQSANTLLFHTPRYRTWPSSMASSISHISSLFRPDRSVESAES